MKCPNCGKKIADDKLFCEFCGEEINIVPDYDPNTDMSIDIKGVFDKTKELDVDEVKKNKRIRTSNVYRDEADYDDFDEDTDDVDDESDSYNIKDLFFSFIDFWNRGIIPKIVIIFVLVVFIFAIFGVVYLVKNFSHKNTYEYYIEQGDLCFNDKDYENAIKFYEEALLKDSSDISIRYKISDAYLADDQDNNAIYVLKEIANENPDLEEDSYDKIFQILYDNKDWVGINDILENCDNKAIVSKFQEYLCKKPDFSETPGTYDEELTLEITGSPNGFIYYTLDGSEPNESSILYTEPLYFESGEYNLKAVYVSEYGVISDVMEGTYIIDIDIPLAPQVSIESGSYKVPILISVVTDVDCKTYYTIKRPNSKEEITDPDMDSTEYTDPILMPMGTSEFRFVSYNSEGVPSTVITRTYTVTIDQSVVSLVDAANRATEFRYSQGGLLDTDGHSATGGGRFTFIIEDAVNIKGTIYYVVNEYYYDNNVGKTSFTGKRIAVNSKNIDDYGWLEINAMDEYYVSRPITY